MEYKGNGKHICHTCIRRAKFGCGNCQDGGQIFSMYLWPPRKKRKTTEKECAAKKKRGTNEIGVMFYRRCYSCGRGVCSP